VLLSNTAGTQNTANGAFALFSNTTGNYNTASGGVAMFGNTVGTFNSAFGQGALYSNTIGNFNTAVGAGALFSNTTGIENTATGFQSLPANTTGSYNTANSYQALFGNTTGAANTATGFQALLGNTAGNNNTATGFQALLSNTAGDNNIALGSAAGLNLTTGSNNIDIGNAGVVAEANTIRIGETQTACFIAGINGATASGGAAVFIDANGQLGTMTSSARFKDDIEPMDKASVSILALKPVTFRYKKEIDAKGIPQFGLVAEEVEKVNPDLVVHGTDGKTYTVRYEAVNVMLLNEFLKEHRNVQEQQKEIEALRTELKEQASQIQKVSAQLEANKPAPQTVLNNQ
jgi:hypothetical protein